MPMQAKFERMRVLLIEDHEGQAAALTAILFALGFKRVKRAINTQQAIEKLQNDKFDLILCDYQLGIVNGLMLVRMIRRPDGISHPMIPILMVTAHADPERVAEALNAGVNDFLVKPVSPEALLRALTGAIERPRAFIKTREYNGPDRRRKQMPDNPGRRAEDAGVRPLVNPNKWIVPPRS